MRSFIVINAPEDVEPVVKKGMDFAYPIEVAVIKRAVIDAVVKKAAGYSSGGTMYIGFAMYQYMYK